MSQLFVLFEHAAGYALFQTTEFEEISMMLPQVEEKMQDLASFRSIVQLIAFTPFKTQKDSIESITKISEGVLPPCLQVFLETNVPKSKKKKQPVVLGVADPKIGVVITEQMGISCQTTGVVPEILRGIRLHFPNLVNGLKENSALQAQVGLGLNYSRTKVKFNVHKVDNMIIQCISLLDQLDKDINTFAMRMREWYSYHFPELVKFVPESHLYAKVVGIIKDRKQMSEDVEEKLEETLQDSTKVQQILDAARSSMGMEIAAADITNIEVFARRTVELAEFRKELMAYLKSKMHGTAPNLATLVGETVGARLISHAGSLTNLAKCPASTVQILGAEKALFRALKTRGNTPKYGLIFHSTFIGRAAKQNKGRISRYLANKCSIASRIDCFSDVPTEVFGQKLKKQVEDRLKFYETGEIPAKNLDVMTEAAEEAVAVQTALLKKKKKKAKKEKKRQEQESLNDVSQLENSVADASEEVTQNGFPEDGDSPSPKKKRKLKHENADGSNVDGVLDEAPETFIPKKKKKKNTEKNQDDEGDISNAVENDGFSFENSADVDLSPKKKKKKKKKNIEAEDSTFVSELSMSCESSALDVSEGGKKKKKKKNKAEVDE